MSQVFFKGGVQLEEARVLTYVASYFAKDASGHGLDHILRVAKMATYISEKEKVSLVEKKKVRLLALLHEMLDGKFFPNPLEAETNLRNFLIQQGNTPEACQEWIQAVAAISFSKRSLKNEVPFWVKIVQDADLLDAIGAIGIGRTFMYGAIHGSKMYDEKKVGVKDSSILQHFDDKLLKIPDLLSTKTGFSLGQERKKIMVDFIAAFLKEWEGQ